MSSQDGASCGSVSGCRTPQTSLTATSGCTFSASLAVHQNSASTAESAHHTGALTVSTPVPPPNPGWGFPIDLPQLVVTAPSTVQPQRAIRHQQISLYNIITSTVAPDHWWLDATTATAAERDSHTGMRKRSQSMSAAKEAHLCTGSSRHGSSSHAGRHAAARWRQQTDQRRQTAGQTTAR
jgi:hypothetical protein